ncbi:ROK family protein [Methylobacillus flagellatus]|uniref:Glucokinase n=1 Tax=Methylobacillus flagellatus (strain ATCC 51484 / DSM 6875 / VKM B-1610 / KT) TaxID=265072 RepID=Q1H1J8_METFK|nr:ROK family protein [Methylobacillus flagellatus]ABE49639.1 glucokinase [Methylobacillus flagellatus KT]
MAKLRLGVDIGGTNLRVGVVQDKKVIYEQRFPANFSSICKQHAPAIALQEILRVSLSALQQAIKLHPGIESIGMGFPGFIDPQSGHVTQSPNLPGLRNVDIAGELSRLLGLPVKMENDALVAALGEFMLLDTIPRSMVYIGLGTGVGGGLIHAARPYPGDHGIAMEVGHLITEPGGRKCGCGNHGCLEQYAAAPGVIASYALATGKTLSARDIADRAAQGDSAALDAYALAGQHLGRAIAHVAKVLDPQLILIGGGLSQAWPYFSSALHAQLDLDSIPVFKGKIDIQVSSSSDQAGIIGAAHLVHG